MATAREKQLAITILKERLEHATGKKVLFTEGTTTTIDSVKIVKTEEGHIEFYFPSGMTSAAAGKWKKDNKDAIDRFKGVKKPKEDKDDKKKVTESTNKDSELLQEGFWDSLKSAVGAFVSLTPQNVVAENTKLLQSGGKLAVDKATGKVTWKDPNAAKLLAWMLEPNNPKLKNYIVATNANKSPVFEFKKSPDMQTFIWRKINYSGQYGGGHGEGATTTTGITITRNGQIIDAKNPEYNAILQKVGLGGEQKQTTPITAPTTGGPVV